MSPAVGLQGEVLGVVRERIARYATSRIGRPNAEDLAQEVVVLLIQKYSHVVRIEDLLPLAIQTMKFKMLGYRRKMRRSGIEGAVPVEDIQLASQERDASEEMERREKSDRLIAAVNKLGDRCRELYRHKLEGRGYEEIRVLMGAKTAGAVYTWDFRCREQLKQQMGSRP